MKTILLLMLFISACGLTEVEDQPSDVTYSEESLSKIPEVIADSAHGEGGSGGCWVQVPVTEYYTCWKWNGFNWYPATCTRYTYEYVFVPYGSPGCPYPPMA